VFALAVAPGGAFLASGGADAAAVVWDVRALAPLAAVGGVDHPIKSVSFGGAAAPAPPAAASTLPAASLLAYGGDGDAIGVEAWASPPPGGARPPPFLLPVRGRVEQLAFAPAPPSSSSSARGGGLAFTGTLYAGARGDAHGAVGLFAPPA
jgi:hypothetical protein